MRINSEKVAPVDLSHTPVVVSKRVVCQSEDDYEDACSVDFDSLSDYAAVSRYNDNEF